MIKIRSLKFWTVVVLAFITLSLTLSTTCVATSSIDVKKYSDAEYQVQLNNLKNEINKINDDVKKGDISKEDANKKIKSLIDDPKYYQIKIKKQITEQEHEALKNNPPHLKLDPKSPDFKTLKLDADRSSIDKVAPGITSNSNLVSPNTVYNYWYTTLTNIYATNAGGWGVGYYKCTKTVSSKELRIGCRAEALGSYYSQGYFEKVFTAPRSGNCVIRGDIDWTGGCFYPDICYIEMTMYKYEPSTGGWIDLGSNNIVSLAGIRGTNGPYNAYTTVNTYLTSGATYSCLMSVVTQASADATASVADFGLDAIGGQPCVHWKQIKLTYY